MEAPPPVGVLELILVTVRMGFFFVVLAPEENKYVVVLVQGRAGEFRWWRWWGVKECLGLGIIKEEEEEEEQGPRGINAGNCSGKQLLLLLLPLHTVVVMITGPQSTSSECPSFLLSLSQSKIRNDISRIESSIHRPCSNKCNFTTE